MGIKLFVIDYVYYKFPKVKRKYDSVYKLWKSLPTRQEWEWTHVQSHIDDVSYLISKMRPLLVHIRMTVLVDIIDKIHVYTFVLYHTYSQETNFTTRQMIDMVITCLGQSG